MVVGPLNQTLDNVPSPLHSLFFFYLAPPRLVSPLPRGTRSPRHATMGAYLSAPVTTKVRETKAAARRTGGASLFRGRRIVNGRGSGALARPTTRAALPPRANARAVSKACYLAKRRQKGGKWRTRLASTRADMNFFRPQIFSTPTGNPRRRVARVYVRRGRHAGVAHGDGARAGGGGEREGDEKRKKKTDVPPGDEKNGKPT